MAGDGAWHTRKVILGWMVDSVQGTLTLPPHRQQRLLTILAETQAKRRVSLSNWRKVVGELRSMTIALPGSEGLFAHLQEAMAKASTQRRITINSDLRDALADWDWLASNISQRPTSLAEVVGKPISWMGACDASAAGMGGVWFDASGSNPPLFWRHRFPTHVTRRVISHSNPTGDLTNSDLELTAVVAHQDVLSQLVPHLVQHRNLAVLSDNTQLSLGLSMAPSLGTAPARISSGY